MSKNRQYLFLNPTELHHLDNEWGSASFVLNGPQECPNVVHAEGLRPAPVTPSLNADVQQLQDGSGQDMHTKTETKDTRHQRLAIVALVYPEQNTNKQQDSLFTRFWWGKVA